MDVRVSLVRTVAIMVPVVAALGAFAWVRPGPRQAGALLLAFLWNVPALTALNMLAQRVGWWQFSAEGGLFFGIPVDLLLGWAVMWGALAGFLVLYYPVWAAVAVALLLDVVLMPACKPVVVLGPSWMLGEYIAVAVCLVPGLLLVRWTTQNRWLAARVLLQMGIYCGLFLFLVPAMALQAGYGELPDGGWMTSALLELTFLVALPGVSALQEFAVRGRGTPYPFDPPRELVSTGPYAFVRNPMQLTTGLLFLVLGALLESWAVVAAAVINFAYAEGLASWHESQDFVPRQAAGGRWQAYRDSVPRWIPRLRPYRANRATLYVAAECDICQQVRQWFLRRGVVALDIVAAEEHPIGNLNRITYVDGNYEQEGIAAVARALEHVTFPWACIGFAMRLPGVRWGLQLISDAVIAPPRLVERP